ncbi:MAG: chromate transporter [Anaerosacchariphilus sp.]
MQAGVGAVIASVVYDMGSGIVHSKSIVSLLIMLGAFLASCVYLALMSSTLFWPAVVGALRTLLIGEKGGLWEMILLELFFSFLQIGAFSFGGGYAAMPLIQAQVVTKYHWLSMAEFTDLITISQMTPGPIAINSATFVGIKISGVPGALVATMGCILPSCIIVAH